MAIDWSLDPYLWNHVSSRFQPFLFSASIAPLANRRSDRARVYGIYSHGNCNLHIECMVIVTSILNAWQYSATIQL